MQGCIPEPRGEVCAFVPPSSAPHWRWQMAEATGSSKDAGKRGNYLGGKGGGLGSFPDPKTGNVGRGVPIATSSELAGLKLECSPKLGKKVRHGAEKA